ncbi:MAG: heparinase II/III-family protein, partial [Bacteroidota bacterium]
LHKICRYIYQMMDVKGHVPYYGDDDDGRTFILDDGQGHPNSYASILTAGAILFKDPVLKSKAAGMDTRNMILFGEAGKAAYDALPTEKQAPQTVLYKEEGHFFCKSGSGDKEVYLHVDAAPLGYLSIAAHGHADALSFFLWVDGAPIFADMGTYTYHSEPEWRDYFKGTLAHNTIRVDGVDQARAEGPCLWLDHYEVEVLEAHQDPAQDRITARHNGYAEKGVMHTRSYHFDKVAGRITIKDTLDITDGATHRFDVPLHLHPNVTIEEGAGGTFVLRNGEARAVGLKPDPQLSYSLVNGQQEPLLGWHSPSFLQRETTNVLFASLERAESFELITEITIEPAS